MPHGILQLKNSETMKLAVVLFLALASTIIATGQNQIPLQFQETQTYNPLSSSFDLFVVDRSPTDSQILSLYSSYSTQEETIANISLNENPEWHEFESGQTAIFRVHNPVDLNTLHSIRVDNPQIDNFYTFRYSGGVVGCELRLPETSDTVSVNDSYILTNTDPERKLICLLLLDPDGSLLYDRHIYYQGNVMPASFRNTLDVSRYRISGGMNENMHLLDFNFDDSTHVITGTENFTLYHPERGIYLHAIHSNGTDYSGELIHDGYARLLASQAINDGVVRLFDVRSGTTIDFDPTQEEFMYSVDEDVFELVLIKYSVSGHVEWVNPLSRVESSLENPGLYRGKLISDGTEEGAAAFYFEGTFEGLIGSMFYVNGEDGYTDFETITEDDPTNQSPVYVHTFDAESGSSTALYSLRNNATSTGLFPSREAQLVRVKSFDENRFSLRTSFPKGGAVDWQYIRHFPDSAVLETSSSFNQTYQAHYLILPYSGNQSEIDQYTLDYDVTPPFNSYAELGICKAANNQVLFGGDLYGYYDFSFYPEQLVNVNADYFNGIGLMLRTEGIFTNTEESLHKESYRVFPNPTSDQITVDRTQSENANFKIYDSTGRVMLNGSMNNYRKTIRVQDLPNGVYFLNVETIGESGSVAKFIKTD